MTGRQCSSISFPAPPAAQKPVVVDRQTRGTPCRADQSHTSCERCDSRGMTAEDVARRWRSQAPTSHDVYPRATEDVANLECRMNNAHGRSNAPSRTTPQGRRRPSRMCYPKAREQEETPAAGIATKCKERALALARIQAHTDGCLTEKPRYVHPGHLLGSG